jgi:hypothetical protein
VEVYRYKAFHRYGILQSPYTHLIVITPLPGSFRKAEWMIVHFIVKFLFFRTKPIPWLRAEAHAFLREERPKNPMESRRYGHGMIAVFYLFIA